MKLTYAVILLAAGALRAQVQEPRIGFAINGDGLLVEIRGLSASFIVDRTGVKAEAAACSGELCAVRTGDSVGVVDMASLEQVGVSRAVRRRPTSVRPRGGEALEGAAGAAIGFSRDGQAAVVFRPQSSDIAVWRSGAWSITPVSPTALGGEVVSIALDGGSARLAVRRESGMALVRVRTSDGAIEDDAPLADARDSALVCAGGEVVITSDAAMIIQRADGDRTRVDMSSPASRMAQIGDSWVAVTTRAGRNYALRLDGPARAYAIPEVQQ